MHFEVSRDIVAKPETVWSILTNVNRLETGGFGIVRLQGEIAAGRRIKVWSEANPGRAFPLKVSVFAPYRQMAWEGGMPFGLFKGMRRFELSETRQGCGFWMREDYSGLLLALIGQSIPDLQPSFEKFANALKRAAEGA